MNLYKISQTKNKGLDTYDSAVVTAESEEAARFLHPLYKDNNWYESSYAEDDWAMPKDVKVELIGTTDKEANKVICASFNAG